MSIKRVLLQWVALLGLLFCSCQDEAIDVPPDGEFWPVPFSVGEARDFFESNATDLSPLSFFSGKAARGSGRSGVELSPEWAEALSSGHRGVTLIEVPLRGTSRALVRERSFEAGRVVAYRMTCSGRRLMIAKRADGEIEMFVATIIPETSSGDVEASREVRGFRYLGGGTFTGKVFCSTLEGKFVKAFGYASGRPVGRLNTLVGKAAVDFCAGDESYSVFRFSELPVMTRSMFADEETGGDGSRCEHDYYYSECPYNCVMPGGDLDEAVVAVCPYCHSEVCICDYCLYCGKKLDECFCFYCPYCGKNVNECKCFDYTDPGTPDPDPPVTPPVGGGAGGVIPSNPEDPNQKFLDEFKSKYLPPVKLREFGQELGLTPEQVAQVHYKVIESGANASYLDTNRTLSISDQILQRGLSDTDIESIMFHEFVHVKQDLVDGIHLERDKQGVIVMDYYEHVMDDYYVQEVVDDFHIVMEIMNVKNKEDNPAVWDYYYQQYVQPAMDGRERGDTYLFPGNVQYSSNEIEAYRRMFDKYGDRMTPDFLEACEKVLNKHLNLKKRMLESPKVNE